MQQKWEKYPKKNPGIFFGFFFHFYCIKKSRKKSRKKILKKIQNKIRIFFQIFLDYIKFTKNGDGFSFSGNFEGIIQYNKDNRPGNNITINDLCDIMISAKGSPVEKMAEVNNVLLEATNEGNVLALPTSIRIPHILLIL